MKRTAAPYRSSLRQKQAAATRQQILDAMAALIESGVEPTYAAIAATAGVQERTVYRHFPTKDELFEAFWWNVLDARLGKTGYGAGDLPSLLADVERTFLAFDEHARLVTEMLYSKFGLAIRLRTNDRRRAMFERVIRHELPGADAATLRRAAAITQLCYSGMTWDSLRSYWGMDGKEAVASVAQALTAMVQGLRRRKKRRR